MKNLKLLPIPKFGRPADAEASAQEARGKDSDNKPVRRKRKKVEPPKPWGKIERLIVFTFLIAAPLLSIIFFTRAKNSVQNPSVKVLNKVLPEKPKDIEALKKSLQSEIQNLTGTYGIWIGSVDQSYSLGINENEKFDGASLFKLPLMIAYYKELDKGNISPETTYTLKYSDSQTGAGVLAALPAGTVVTYQDVIDAMGKNSDNTAFQIMLNILGNHSEVNIINYLGMENTDFSSSQTTPSDMGLLFSKLENDNIISNSSKDTFYKSLTKTDFEDLIPKSVDENIKVVHKFGTDEGELNDAGIVYTRNPYIIVILSKDINFSEAQYEIPNLSKIVYNYLK